VKAPRWLTESFRDGVDDRADLCCESGETVECWLAQFDKAQRPCEGRVERFHFIGRQRVEHALGALLPDAVELTVSVSELWRLAEEEPDAPVPTQHVDWTEVIQAAAWDSRNGGIACEAHHRRFDSHLVPLPSEELLIPYSALPEHVLEFAADWGLEDELEAKFGRQEDLHGIEKQPFPSFGEDWSYLERVTVKTVDAARTILAAESGMNPDEHDPVPIYMRWVSKEETNERLLREGFEDGWVECELAHPDAVPFWKDAP
jgi:hypothetical protein